MSSDGWWKVLPGYIGAVTGFVGTVLACRAVNRWHKEMLGKHEFETARNVMVKVLRLEREMSNARMYLHVIDIRQIWEQLRAAEQELELTLIDARAIWGAKRLESAAQAIFQQLQRLRGAAWVVNRRREPFTGLPTDADLKQLRDSEDFLMRESYVTIATAVGSFEDALKEYFPNEVRWSNPFQIWRDKIKPMKEWESDNSH
jgi:hypothetical protein